MLSAWNRTPFDGVRPQAGESWAIVQNIGLASLTIMLVPTLLLISVMWRWELRAFEALYANARMLLQLLLVGYVLTFIFRSENPVVVVAVIVLMIGMSSWISLRTISQRDVQAFLVVVVSIGASGLAILGVVTQLVLELPRWFEPPVVVPIAGMIFANSMNTVALAAERFDSERARGEGLAAARKSAMDAALIPQINSLFAVGLVSLPGMMTGQILSGVDPLIAARYQIVVMAMIFSAAGLAAVTYVGLRVRGARD